LDRRTEAEALLTELSRRWHLVARPTQLQPPGDWWTHWFISAGRGFGKTRAGSEWVRQLVESGDYGRIALVAPTAADARDTMVEGISGILSLNWRKEHIPKYYPSKRRVVFANGVIATTFSAEEPDRLNGPNHHAAWCDEIGIWKYAQDTWDMLMFGLRLGKRSISMITSTPKPTKIVRNLVKDRGVYYDPETGLKSNDLTGKDVIVTTGSTYENLDNLSANFRDEIIRKYKGTRLGDQELFAKLLEDVEGALWKMDLIEKSRARNHPDLVRIVVAVDPSGGGGDEQGIIVVGKGVDGEAYVIDDQSCQLSPDGWGRRAVNAYHHHKADLLVAESNYGGDMVESTIKTVDKSINFKKLHASRGKMVRAEPVAALYEQDRVHHVGAFAQLEDQMTSYVPGTLNDSPDRMDAMVWGVTELMLGYAESRVTII